MGPDGSGRPFNQEECAPKRVGKLIWCDEWSQRSGLNGRPAVYECEQDTFKKARCFKWFPRFLFEYRSLESFPWLY